MGDNLLSTPRAEALVTLSALAARTQQVRLGTICLASFPLRDPLLFGIQWASLDMLSHGRTVLSVCIGGGPQDGPQFAAELDNLGVKAHERVGRLVEGVTLLRRLWSEERVTHAGKYYRYTDVTLLPKPLQQPLPILIASNPKDERVSSAVVDRILRRVATYGDGWQTDATPVETFRQRFDTIRTYAERQGRDSAQLESCLHLMVNINDDRDKAYQEAATFLSSYYGAGAVSREHTELWLAYGPPAAVIDKIHAYLEAGCTTPVAPHTLPEVARLRVDRRLLPGDDPAQAVAEVRQVLGDLAPYQVSVTQGPHMLPALVDPDHPGVRALKAAHRLVRGTDLETYYGQGSYDAGGPCAAGVPTVMYGVGGGEHPVGVDFVPLSHVLDEARVLIHTIVALLGA